LLGSLVRNNRVAIPLRGFISFQPGLRWSFGQRGEKVAIPLRGFISFQRVLKVLFDLFNLDVAIPLRGFISFQRGEKKRGGEAGGAAARSNPLARIHLISTFVLKDRTGVAPRQRSNPLARIHLISTRGLRGRNALRSGSRVAIPLRGFISFQQQQGEATMKLNRSSNPLARIHLIST